jgi:hypothetical protein
MKIFAEQNKNRSEMGVGGKKSIGNVLVQEVEMKYFVNLN